MSNKRGRVAAAVLAVLFPAAAWADSSGTQTLSANTRFSFDTGATVTSGGDILFTGTSISMQGAATDFDLGPSGSAEYSSLSQATLSSFLAAYSAGGISGSSLVVNEVFAVHTIGSHFAAVLITAVSSTSVSFKYTTFGVSGGTGGGGGPTVTGLLNNYSNVQPGLPNYGIAPGSIFVIYGTGMSNPAVTTAVLQDSKAAGGIPLTLNGASITVTAANGAITHPGIYYATPTQIAAVLPSSTQVGTGTIAVSYNNVTSAPFNIQVVTSALGLDTFFGTGSGQIAATNASYAVFNYNTSASPGQTIILWGSGLGADTADSDTAYTTTPHTVNTSLQIYIGGILANITYQGSSGFPGLNQINVVIPTTVQTGCGVSLVAATGNVVSNAVSIPINPGGGVCSDSALGINGNQILTQGGQTTTPAYSSGSLGVSQSISGGTTSSVIAAYFQKYQAAQSVYTGFTEPSLGSCIVITSIPSTTTTIPTLPTGLDAGTINVAGPGGTQQVPAFTIPGSTGASGEYLLQPSSTFVPATFGTFTFTGSGGKDVGPFTASISYPGFNWTNMNAITSINRSQGVTLNWTGGASGSYVFIDGGASLASGVGVTFECFAPVSAGQFTVPPSVLLAVPISSNGSLSIYNSAIQSFTASGLTTAQASAGVSLSTQPAYQ